MGGYGSGRKEETAKADDALCLRVNRLQKQGSLNPGRHLITWSGRESSIGLDARETNILLSFTSQRGAMTQRVELEYTANNYGGRRPWFRCPRCSRRVGVLYFRRGGFTCRPCSGLKYRSQSEGLSDRMRRKARKIRDRLGEEHKMRVLVSRPRGMHRKTFFRLEEELVDLESMVQQHELEEAIRCFRLKIYPTH